MVDNDFKLRRQREEALREVGYIGRLLGQGETGKNNAVFCLALLLTLVAAAFAFAGKERFVDILIPVITLLIGRFTKD